MSSSQDAEEAPQLSFFVKSSTEAKIPVTISAEATVLDLKEKLSADVSVPATSQRLIYSGRVLKDTDTLTTYKIQNGHTLHLVKSAAPKPPAAAAPSASSGAASAALPASMATGTGNNPLAHLTGARYAGLAQLPNASMFGPDGGMGPPPGPEDLANLMNDPGFASQMDQMLSNPAMIDLMLQSSPHLASMGPEFRQMLQSPEFRRMITNPDMIRSMSQMRGGLGGPGGGAAPSAFPAPGPTSTMGDDAPHSAGNTGGANAGSPGSNPPNPLANPYGMNPFLPFLGAPGAQPAAPGATSGENTTATSGATAGSPPANPGNPFGNLFDPNFLAQLQQAQAAAGQQGGANPSPFYNPQLLQQILGMGNPTGSPPPPADNRPPEERYADQLRQLNDMGFFDFDRNVQALRRSGGSVQGAVEFLLSSL